MEGKAWKYGDNINTDIISPPAYMELPIDKASQYTMSVIETAFASSCKAGDLFVAEHNLGSGSSRETAPLMLKQCGIQAVIAKSFARIFYRNCINVGIVAIECKETDKIHMGDMLSLDLSSGIITNKTTGESYPCEKMPEHILALVQDGGLIAHLKKKGEHSGREV